MPPRPHTVPFLLAALLALGACTGTIPSPQGPAARTTVDAAPTPGGVGAQEGVVRAVRTVAVEHEGAQAAGAVVGGLVGGIVGNRFGEGQGNTVMTGVGAAGGALVGVNLGAQQTRYAQEWTIRLANGRSIAVVQDDSFAVGQPVLVLFEADGRARIMAR